MMNDCMYVTCSCEPISDARVSTNCCLLTWVYSLSTASTKEPRRPISVNILQSWWCLTESNSFYNLCMTCTKVEKLHLLSAWWSWGWRSLTPFLDPAEYRWGIKIRDFQPIYHYITETVEDKHELLIGRLLISMILNELKRPYPDIYFPDKREIWHGSLLPPVPNFAAPCQISRLSGQKCENSAQNWQNIEFWPYICPSRATRLHNFLRNSQPLYASLGRF